MKSGSHKHRARRLPSLRSRYVLLSVVVAAVLVAGAVTATWYTRGAVADNTAALELSNRARASLDEIRNAVWIADNTLNAMLIAPTPGHEDEITYHMAKARESLGLLRQDPDIRVPALSDRIDALDQYLDALDLEVTHLMEQRRDPNWVYPLLPYLTEHLLVPNVNFETAADLALQEISDIDGRSHASEIYGDFDDLRDLWRRMILNFRAGMIRYAGLSETRVQEQEQEVNIGILFPVIIERLDHLETRLIRGELGLESEHAVTVMRQAAIDWKTNWTTAREIRDAEIWRADTEYLKVSVRPAQQRVFDMLTEVETAILDWNAQNATSLQQAAHQTAYQLWALTGLSLLFLLLVYLMVNRSVLAPIQGIARSLNEDGSRPLPGRTPHSSFEIQQLVRAFNGMQRQIHHRQKALEHQALHDSLTRLPNRVLLNDRLGQAIQLLERNGGRMAVLLLDLDRFKEVNDALGHPVGDRLLQQVAKRLRASLRGSDTVARLGGDEFAILAQNTDAEGAVEFAQKIHKAISGVFNIEHQNVYVGTSIGIALFPDHGHDPSTLLRRADIAMYAAKHQGLGSYVYSPDEDDNRADRLSLVGELHEELRKTQNLSVHYQPQVSLPGGEIVGMEALLRWQHPVHGHIPPDEIIRMAEHTGLIAPLTRWVLETALCEFSQLLDQHPDMVLSVNLSAWNLQDPELPAVITAALNKCQLLPSSLSLEITESAMMNDPVHAREILDLLSAQGIGLAVDDYGTGFSSLSYLKLLPVDVLKIDRSFVMEMLEDENDAIIVRSTIDLAHNLGFTVVAEGVENGEVMTVLASLGCDYAQGYHLCRPVPFSQLRTWLDDYQQTGLVSLSPGLSAIHPGEPKSVAS